MHELALKILNTWDIRPLEVVQNTASIDEEFCFVIDDGSCGNVADPELPHALRCIPLGMFDLVLELDVLVDEVIFFVDAFEVFEDLWRVGIEVIPCLDSPCELVVDARNL